MPADAQVDGHDRDTLTEKKLKRVLVMFKKLQVEFDTKFRKIFA